jgi:electron transfer flavoprotein beta subunit
MCRPAINSIHDSGKGRQKMRTVIVYKWARNAEDAAVRSDGSVDWRNAKMTAGEDDFAALDAAKAIAEGSELIGLTIGDGDASWALARGVLQATSVFDAPNLTDNASTAAIIAAAVQQIGSVDAVVIGDSEEYSGVPVALAGLLGWPAIAHVSSASTANGRVQIVRKQGKNEQTISIAAPVVVAVSAASAEKAAPGMKEQLAARKRPITKLTLDTIGVNRADKVACKGTRLPEVTAARIFDGDPALAAEQLVAALRDQGVL